MTNLYAASHHYKDGVTVYLFTSDGHFLDNDWAIVEALGITSYDPDDGDTVMIDPVETDVNSIPFVEKV